MTGIVNVNLKVLVLDTDFYAQQAINGYLAWDRRTRVTFLADSIEQMWNYLEETALAELPDVVVMDADHVGGPNGLTELIASLRRKIPDLRVVCLAQFSDPQLVEAAADANANAYLLKQDVRLQIAWAIVYTLADFVVTPGSERLPSPVQHAHLPRQRPAGAARIPRTDRPHPPGHQAVCGRRDARAPGRRRNGHQPAHHSRLH
jgi:CheY-like chemotaxis protein